MITDVNINLSRWPFRRLPHDEAPKLVGKLSRAGITQAWTSSFDGLLHHDISALNQRLADDCKQHGQGILVPFGCINPGLLGWQKDLIQCKQKHQMPGIRLFPNYHNYKLDDPVFRELLAKAEQEQLVVQIALKMEDERTQHPHLRVPAVDMKPLPELAGKHPKTRIVILNGMKTLRGDILAELVKAGNVYFDISMQESVGGIEKMLQSIPLQRVLFGSHFPFFYLESALLKLKESNLGRFREEAIRYKNAAALLGR